MNKICIRKVTLKDLALLQQIGQQTFLETFSAQNSAEDVMQYLAESFSVEKLTEELSNISSEFYFALDGEAVIGYLKVNFGPAQTELQDNHSLEIERIYVLQKYQGRKVGKILYEKALEIAKQKQYQYMWLGVWEKNERAIRFYEKQGFRTFDKHIFRLGSDEQTDLMMKLML